MSFSIRILQLEDVSSRYVKWFSDDDVVKFSDNQYRKFSLNSQIDYIKSCLNDEDIDLYGIFDLDHHIGNISISGLNSPHKRAEISYVIGSKSHWGKGAAAFAIAEIIALARTKYNLNKLFAGLADKNIGSRKVLEKNGFILEGTRIEHLYYNGDYYDQLDFGLILKK